MVIQLRISLFCSCTDFSSKEFTDITLTCEDHKNNSEQEKLAVNEKKMPSPSPKKSLRSLPETVLETSPKNVESKESRFDTDNIMKFLMEFKVVVAKYIKNANETVTEDIKKANKENCDAIERKLTENMEQVKMKLNIIMRNKEKCTKGWKTE